MVTRGVIDCRKLFAKLLGTAGWALWISLAMSVPILANPVEVVAATGTRLSIGASAGSATVSSKVTLTGTLKTTSGKAIRSRSVRLERYDRSAWVLAGRYTTNSYGKVYAKVQPSEDRKYRFRYVGSSTFRGSSSPSKSVGGYTSPTLDFTGSGNAVVGPFTLERGLSVARSVPGATESNFIIWLVDAAGNEIELLANEIGTIRCSAAVKVPSTGNYYLNVTSDTSWTVEVAQPRQLSAPATRSFSGNESATSQLFTFSKAGYKFTWQNSGSSNFIVTLLDRDGGYVKLISNEIGSSTGEIILAAPAAGQYILDIDADGPWSLNCSPL